MATTEYTKSVVATQDNSYSPLTTSLFPPDNPKAACHYGWFVLPILRAPETDLVIRRKLTNSGNVGMSMYPRIDQS